MGADGVNPIEFLVLVGDADRQWLELWTVCWLPDPVPRRIHLVLVPLSVDSCVAGRHRPVREEDRCAPDWRKGTEKSLRARPVRSIGFRTVSRGHCNWPIA